MGLLWLLVLLLIILPWSVACRQQTGLLIHPRDRADPACWSDTSNARRRTAATRRGCLWRLRDHRQRFASTAGSCQTMAVTAVADELQIDEAPFARGRRSPGRSGLPRPPQDLERLVRQAPCTDHSLRGVSDVIAAVRFGRDSGLPVAVRSRRALFPGPLGCGRCVMIDLQPMKGVPRRPGEAARRASGRRAARRARQGKRRRSGLAVPSGIVTHTGVAGLTLGGGIGWIQRISTACRSTSSSRWSLNIAVVAEITRGTERA